MIVVCIGGGESLTPADVDYCRGRAKVLAINDAYRLAPWAEWHYACDYGWNKFHAEALKSFEGERWTQDIDAAREFGLRHIECDPGGSGLCDTPGKINGGNNGGYQAINFVYHKNPTKILLLGYDMQGGHWFGSHNPSISGPAHSADYGLYASAFPRLAADLDERGIEVVNCSRQTALTCFRRSTIDKEL